MFKSVLRGLAVAGTGLMSVYSQNEAQALSSRFVTPTSPLENTISITNSGYGEIKRTIEPVTSIIETNLGPFQIRNIVGLNTSTQNLMNRVLIQDSMDGDHISGYMRGTLDYGYGGRNSAQLSGGIGLKPLNTDLSVSYSLTNDFLESSTILKHSTRIPFLFNRPLEFSGSYRASGNDRFWQGEVRQELDYFTIFLDSRKENLTKRYEEVGIRTKDIQLIDELRGQCSIAYGTDATANCNIRYEVPINNSRFGSTGLIYAKGSAEKGLNHQEYRVKAGVKFKF